MTDMPVFMHFFYGFFATIGFSIFLCAPKKVLIPCGFAGALGWAVYYFLATASVNNVNSNFLATILVTFVSEFLARRLKQPAIIFIIPGIIPLVPGLGMYNTMLYLVQGNFNDSIAKGADVVFVGGAIALGVLIVTSLSNTLHRARAKRNNRE